MVKKFGVFLVVLPAIYLLCSYTILYFLEIWSEPIECAEIINVEDDTLWNGETDFYSWHHTTVFVVSKHDVHCFFSQGRPLGSFIQNGSKTTPRRLFVFNLPKDKLSSPGVFYAAESKSFNDLWKKAKRASCLAPMPFDEFEADINRLRSQVFGVRSQ